MFFKRFLALLNTRNKEFLRDRSTLMWNIMMPVFLVTGFAITFTGDFTDQYKVGVIDLPRHMAAQKNHPDHFLQTRYIEFINIDDLPRAQTKIERHQLDLLIDLDKREYWLNQESPNGYLVEKIMLSSSSEALKKQTLSGKEIRYVDWVIPGILGMNIMFSALFGVGYVIVRYRKNGMLKRLKATPVTAFEYLSVQITSRLILIMVVTSLVFFATNFFIGYAMHGSYLDLLLVFALGAFSLISLSLIVASRTKSEEAAGGLLNLISWPMMFLSGVWFSLEGTNPIMQQIAEFLPLTHVIEAARQIMIDGASLFDLTYHLIILIGQSILFLIIGSALFRWE